MLLINPPETIKGKSVNTDFRLWIRVGRVLQGNYMNNEKVSMVCNLVFDEIPNTDEEAYSLFAECLRFYNCGRDAREVPPPPEQLLDWEHDSMTIWADFKIYARIDIDTAYMHWWKFYALFQSLPSDARIKELISVRSEDLSDYGGKGQEKTREKKRLAKILAAIRYDASADY